MDEYILSQYILENNSELKIHVMILLAFLALTQSPFPESILLPWFSFSEKFASKFCLICLVRRVFYHQQEYKTKTV